MIRFSYNYTKTQTKSFLNIKYLKDFSSSKILEILFSFEDSFASFGERNLKETGIKGKGEPIDEKQNQKRKRGLETIFFLRNMYIHGSK